MLKQVLIASLFAGCTGAVFVRPVRVAPVYAAPAPVYAAPEMVSVSPGVQVIADYDQPVFYSDGMYWRSMNGAWYSSRVHNGGWAMSYSVPVGVRGISRPETYVHYRNNAGRPAPVVRQQPTRRTRR